MIGRIYVVTRIYRLRLHRRGLRIYPQEGAQRGLRVERDADPFVTPGMVGHKNTIALPGLPVHHRNAEAVTNGCELPRHGETRPLLLDSGCVRTYAVLKHSSTKEVVVDERGRDT